MSTKTLKQRIYEVIVAALTRYRYLPLSCNVVDTVAITLPEIKETEKFVQTSKGDYLLSNDGYVLTTKNS